MDKKTVKKQLFGQQCQQCGGRGHSSYACPSSCLNIVLSEFFGPFRKEAEVALESIRKRQIARFNGAESDDGEEGCAQEVPTRKMVVASKATTSSRSQPSTSSSSAKPQPKTVPRNVVEATSAQQRKIRPQEQIAQVLYDYSMETPEDVDLLGTYIALIKINPKFTMYKKRSHKVIRMPAPKAGDVGAQAIYLHTVLNQVEQVLLPGYLFNNTVGAKLVAAGTKHTYLSVPVTTRTSSTNQIEEVIMSPALWQELKNSATIPTTRQKEDVTSSLMSNMYAWVQTMSSNTANLALVADTAQWDFVKKNTNEPESLADAFRIVSILSQLTEDDTASSLDDVVVTA